MADRSEEAPKPALPYEPAPPVVSRRTIRVLLLLTLLNTALLTIFIAGPTARNVIVQQWEAHKAKQAAAVAQAQTQAAQVKLQARQLAANQAAAAQRQAAATQAAAQREATLAAQAECLTFQRPVEELVYAEDFEGIDKLKSAGVVKELTSGQDLGKIPPAVNWLPAVAAMDPKPLVAMPARLKYPKGWVSSDETLHGPASGTLFVHGRQASPGGPTKLVVVTINVQQGWREAVGGPSGGALLRMFDLTTHRQISAISINLATAAEPATLQPATVQKPSSDFTAGTLAIQPLDAQRNPAGELRFVGRQQLRIYAGQPDPSDPSRFNIPYELDTRRGLITGRVRENGSIELELRGGLDNLASMFQNTRDELIPAIAKRYEKLLKDDAKQLQQQTTKPSR